MKYFKFSLAILLIASFLGLFAYYFFFLVPADSTEQLYNIETPVKQGIKQAISATGLLKLKGQVKVGSLVDGRIQAIMVKENDPVVEGQLLAEIDTGLGDTEVREAEGSYEKTLAELEYQEVYYQRQKQLFEEKFISQAVFEEAKRDYQMTLADAKRLKANYEKQLLAYKNNKIYAPTSGIIIHIDMAKGEKISSDLDGGTLFLIAPDITQIEAELEITEKDIGQIQEGQNVQMNVDTYPNKIFESSIQKISFFGKGEADSTYQAKAYLHNSRLLLRPGMNVNAIIDVASVDSALTLSSQPFLVKQEHLVSIAELLDYSIEPIDHQAKQALLKSHPDQNMQFVWKVCEHCFQEIPIEVGITDNISFEIRSGLKGDEQLIADVMEADQMQKIYEKFYRRL